MTERGFLNFLKFFAFFFRNFLAGDQYQRNSGLKYFSPFPGLSHPVLLGNNAGKGFFNFFAISFGTSMPGSNMNGIRA